ncbi:hypothetical protein [Actinokineospora sp. HUAS TT18]|uniref:hypothetical protein n=1 Tax=Actinokineospora sp. HUAS TT18 TaxID=3447451 RepID=UPI003F51FD0A
MVVRRGAAVLSAVLVACGVSSCSALGGDCSSYLQTKYIPARSPLVFERDGVTLAVNRDPVRTLTVIVTSSDGRYDQARVDPHVELAEGIELGTTFGFDWVAPGKQAPGQVRPALRVYDCWRVVKAPSDVF